MSAAPRAEQIDEARALMIRFAERTGIEGEAPPRRYLWTDAFAVCNALALFEATGETRFRRMAFALVEQVHAVLARYRPDDTRQGWLSGLGDEEARRHPTCAGLRIGKPLPERAPSQPFDERLEWDRDGQYFHYLTRWMHALDQLARWSDQAHYNLWARELLLAGHRGFVSQTGGSGPLRMFWKMSVDLTRPLVASMGQHDPLDGFVTGLQLRASAESLPEALPATGIDRALADFAALAARQSIATRDPLGIGGLLLDASRVAQLRLAGALDDDGLFVWLLDSACRSLDGFLADNDLDQPASRRLAFRELGLAIGLAALEPIERLAGACSAPAVELEAFRTRLATLRAGHRLREDICRFWRRPAHQEVAAWGEHADINDVMLATALLPEGWVTLVPSKARPVRGEDRPDGDASALPH